MRQSPAFATIDIRPDVSVYATYRRLSYTPWYAIAEFVDNSTQNYYDHRDSLRDAYKRDGKNKKLRVEISYDSERNTLTILDNANGMNFEELTRAVILDKPPENRSGRCEYGMGLKTASCWFGTAWTIQTSRLGSDKELIVTVNVTDLVENHTNVIRVQGVAADPKSHFTRITIQGLYKPIRGRTPPRIKDQLGSMYREDIRSGEVEIIWNGEPISFQEPTFLTESLGNGAKSVWRKNVSFAVPWESEGTTLQAHGWIGIRMPGSQRDAGFALLRRGRVIIGGPGEGYKPIEVFGQGNTFRSQRLVGELNLNDWPVTQAKDAFDWSGGLEDAFIEELRRHCEDYMDKSEGYRQPTRPLTGADLELSSERSKEIFSSKRFTSAIAEELKFPDPPKTPEQEKADAKKLRAVSVGPVTYKLDVGEEVWQFRLHWQDQLSDAHWMQVSYPQDHQIDVFLNMAHPFLAPYLDKKDLLELIQKFVLALALAEKMARQTAKNGLISPGDIRTFMNKVLRRAGEIEVEHGG
ncbi:MAG: hypothetical protein HW389_745 [Bacteroidetes bacterium]|nr:hypothetical protein [Bacteroidota bacterium]